MIVPLKSLSLCVTVVVVSLALVGGASLPECLMKPELLTLSLPRDRFVPLEKEELGEFAGPCEVFEDTEWMRMPAGSRDLLVSADGPSGSLRYWHITVGVAQRTERKPSRCLYLETSTVGWRTLQRYKDLPLRWLDDLDGDGNAELIIWDSFPLYKEAELNAFGLIAWVYRLVSEESLAIDWGLSRRMARDIAKAYHAPLERRTDPFINVLRAQAAAALEQFAEERCTIATADKR